ncbi:MAG TPA: hypothetical protein VGX28_13740 [Frankiaceae bacterium]|jgi:ABC-type Co2+ transport system permease subunit|nr:hypothetical protein [Frankiaceae bacterium]
MHEVVPVAVGVVLGIALSRVRQPRLRAVLAALLGAVAGVVVSAATGELASGWFYAVWDVAQVVGCAAGVLVLATAARRRPLSRG